MAATDAVLARLQVLEDLHAVTEVIHNYGHHIDRCEIEPYLNLFTPTGRFRARVQRPDGAFDKDRIDVSGTKALEAFIKGLSVRNREPPYAGQVNIISQPVVKLDGDRATALTYFTIVRTCAGQREIFSYGRYNDELVRCEDGAWRIQDRISEIESVKTN